MNEKVRTAVNLAAVILVPLINERQKIKNDPEFIRAKNTAVNALAVTKEKALEAKDTTVKAGKIAAHTSIDIKDKTVAASQFVAAKTKDIKEKNKEYQEARQEKKEQRRVSKMNQTLQKEIEKRRKADASALKQQQKEMKKDFKHIEKIESRKTPEDIASTQYVMNRVRQTEKSHLTDDKNIALLNQQKVLRHEQAESTDNAPLFEQHREMMAEEIRRYKS